MWEEKCRRIANFGKEFALADVYKKVAVKKILCGQALHNFDLWESDKSLSWGCIVEKLKAYARGKKLDREAGKDKQAVGPGKAQEKTQEENRVGSWVNGYEDREKNFSEIVRGCDDPDCSVAT